MLTLGIPSNAVMALMVGAMIIQGIQPGPEVMTKKPDLFWGMIVSMWIGNLMLVVINLPMIGMWVKLLTVPYRFLAPAILLFCCIGAYSLQNSTFHVLQVAMFGVLGYVFVRLGSRAHRSCWGWCWARGGGVFPARHAAIARRSDGVHRAADQPRPLDHHRAPAHPDGPAQHQEGAQRRPSRKKADPARPRHVYSVTTPQMILSPALPVGSVL